MSSKNNRHLRKNKTTVLYEVKRNDSQKNIEMARSINIIPLKTINRIVSSSGQKRRLTDNQSVCRHSKRPQKLSLNLANDAILQIDEDFKKQFGTEQLLFESQKKVDFIETLERMQKAQLITVQNNTIRSDVESFHKICSEFIKKIEELEKDRHEQLLSIRRYEAYFKQLSLRKEYQNQEEDFYEGKQNKKEKMQKGDKNAQLKILNLERKVETLNYIIKNYRSNNKEEIKNFQKKINDFKPSLENQLETLLTEANLKNQRLSGIIQYFQSECEKQMKNGDWIKIVSQMKFKDEKIFNLKENLKNCEDKLSSAHQKIANIQIFIPKYQNLEQNHYKLREQHKLLEGQLEKLLKEKSSKQQENFQLARNYEELTFKYRGLQSLEPKIREKDEIISKNSVTIIRLENEISSLRSKVAVALKASQNQMFGKASVSVDTIENCINDIEELSSRFGEELDNFSSGNSELYSFMTHLFDRTKQSFEKIIEEYRENLNGAQIENKQLKSRLNSMISCGKRKVELGEDILQEIQLIDQKRKRCVASQNDINSPQDCTGCKCWLLNSGQINNHCQQLLQMLKKYLETC